jgi:hypothetical protein
MQKLGFGLPEADECQTGERSRHGAKTLPWVPSFGRWLKASSRLSRARCDILAQLDPFSSARKYELPEKVLSN